MNKVLTLTAAQSESRLKNWEDNRENIEFFRLQNTPKSKLLRIEKNCISQVQKLEISKQDYFLDSFKLKEIQDKIWSFERILNNVRFFL
tara:strand:- start:420 stop:686 length:267 start_codon:yes stop_codon:yes gene_type:complete